MSEERSLEERVRLLEDRVELEELVVRYSNAVDDRDLDVVVDCFCENASISGYVRNSSSGALGKAAIREFFHALLSDPAPTLHYHYSQLLEFQGLDSATGIVLARGELGSSGTCVVSALRYYDQYEREHGRWKFAERSIKFWYAMRLDQLPQYFCDPLRQRWPDPQSPAAADLPESLESYQRLITRGQ